MRIKQEEFNLLVEIYKYLIAEGGRKDLASALYGTIERLDNERQKSNDRQRKTHARNRQNGYEWASSYHPKKSKYYPKGEENE